MLNYRETKTTKPHWSLPVHHVNNSSCEDNDLERFVPLTKLLADLHFWVHFYLFWYVLATEIRKWWPEKCELIGRLPTFVQKQKQYLKSPCIVLTIFILFISEEPRAGLSCPPGAGTALHSPVCPWCEDQHSSPWPVWPTAITKTVIFSILTPRSYKPASRRSGLPGLQDFKHTARTQGSQKATERLRKFFSSSHQKH